MFTITLLVTLVLSGLCTGTGPFDEVDIQKFMDLVDSAPSATTSAVSIAQATPETTKSVLQQIEELMNNEPVAAATGTTSASTTTKSFAQELAEMTFLSVPTSPTAAPGADTPSSAMDYFRGMTLPLDKAEPEMQSTTTTPAWNVSGRGVVSGSGAISYNWLAIAMVILYAEC